MIALITATNRSNSYSSKIAAIYDKFLTELTEEPVFRYSLDQLPVDFLASNLYGKRSDSFIPIEAAMREANKYLFVVPEYNGSFPGVLKLFIDSLKPQETFYGKKAALVGVSKGKFGNIRGLDHLVCVLNYLRVIVLPNRVHIISVHRIYDEATQSLDPTNTEDIRTQIKQFVEL